MNNICPNCEKTELEEGTFSNDFLSHPRDWNGPKIKVDNLRGWYCKKCEDYIIDPTQIIHNQKMVKLARDKDK